MDTQQKLDLENTDQPIIRLYKEGMFWRAFEVSAYRLQQFHSLKPVKVHVKKVARDLVYVGFPEKSLATVLEKATAQHITVAEQEEKRLTLSLPSLPKDESKVFQAWWDTVVIKAPSNKTKKSASSSGVFRHPQVFSDVLILYKQYYAAHSNLPKMFRVTVGDSILRELAECMRLITMANFNKTETNDTREAIMLLKDLRGRIEVIKTWFLLAWEMKLISHGFYAELSKRMEAISKQAARWQQWFQQQCGAESDSLPSASDIN